MKKRLAELAKRDDRNRRDPRFLDTMGFLVAKGLLGYNRPIPEKPNAKLDLRAAVWAGLNVEPRILEVLPAAFLRFPRHFIVPVEPDEFARRLLEIREAFAANRADLPEFAGVAAAKYAVWFDHPLKDRRTRPLSERKRMKVFRLRPDAIDRLAKLAEKRKMSEAEVLEELIGRHA